MPRSRPHKWSGIHMRLAALPRMEGTSRPTCSQSGVCQQKGYTDYLICPTSTNDGTQTGSASPRLHGGFSRRHLGTVSHPLRFLQQFATNLFSQSSRLARSRLHGELPGLPKVFCVPLITRSMLSSCGAGPRPCLSSSSTGAATRKSLTFSPLATIGQQAGSAWCMLSF